MAAPDEPKIIVDTDWKSQAQAEKERLTAAAKPAAPEAKVPGARAAAPGEPARFEDLLSVLITPALMYMGAFPDPQTGRAVVSLEYAKLHIDLLGVLEDKTKGNLAEGERATLSRALNELRLEYVEVSRYVAKAVEEGRVSARPASPSAPVIAPPKS